MLCEFVKRFEFKYELNSLKLNESIIISADAAGRAFDRIIATPQALVGRPNQQLQ
jgi:hypothetical protein